MLLSLAKKIFGTTNDRIIKSINKDVEIINSLEEKYTKMSDEELKGQTPILRAKLNEGASMEDILHEAFAVVREASKRTLNMRHFDVQLIGGIVLHRGMISEMKTGEGKTLVATLPIYLNALTGKGVHLVTVNDYLVKRDAKWMGQIYEFLGLTIGCIVHEMSDEERKIAYNADITYGTNNELGFDYLRDNMKYDLEAIVQRPFNYGIVDEVDSILIDEARTPLIISGPTEDNSELYRVIDRLVKSLGDADFEKDEKSKTITLTEVGHNHIEEILAKNNLLKSGESIYDIGNVSLVHHVNQALRAQHMFDLDVDYMIKEGKVMIIDEFTGRVMEGRRFSEGLHQALEAKEGVEVQNENQTLASITYQNYFRLYPKLAGMTGTAMTEASEFSDIYGLEVVEIPTNMPICRVDEDDEIYSSVKEKNDAIVKLIEDRHNEGQPILVGTVSIEKSEQLADLLKKHKIPHNVLNAKYHEQEAQIIAQAGRLKAVTIATNMAGRGTDIMLGGNPVMRMKEANATDPSELARQSDRILKEVEQEKQQVIELGGLLVIGTERHESRRIDNQLRGRSGRQGDPGRTKFFLSLEDDLMRIFGSDRISGMLKTLGLKEGEAIFHPWISKALEKAQSKVEERNYEIRKNLLKFDDVMNDQRKIVFEQRLDIITNEDITIVVDDIRREVNQEMVLDHIPPHSYQENWDLDGLDKELLQVYGLELNIKDIAGKDGFAEEEVISIVNKETEAHFAGKIEKYGADIMKMAYKRFMLITMDQLWKDHLLSLDHLRQGIVLRAYGQKDPLNEYKREAFELFQNMLIHLRKVAILRLAHIEVNTQSEGFRREMSRQAPNQKMVMGGSDQTQAEYSKVSRNEPCPCGSGKKYKHCHGKLS